jgi:hypothetical protein
MILTKEKLIAELAQAERQVDLLNNQYHCALGVASAFRAMLGVLDQPEPKPAEAAPVAPPTP